MGGASRDRKAGPTWRDECTPAIKTLSAQRRFAIAAALRLTEGRVASFCRSPPPTRTARPFRECRDGRHPNRRVAGIDDKDLIFRTSAVHVRKTTNAPALSAMTVTDDNLSTSGARVRCDAASSLCSRLPCEQPAPFCTAPACYGAGSCRRYQTPIDRNSTTCADRGRSTMNGKAATALTIHDRPHTRH